MRGFFLLTQQKVPGNFLSWQATSQHHYCKQHLIDPPLVPGNDWPHPACDIEQTPSFEIPPHFPLSPGRQPKIVKCSKRPIGKSLPVWFPNIIEHLSIWHCRGLPIFYSVKFLLVPKISEPLLKGSWQWMGFLSAGVWIHSLSCLRISFVIDGPKFGDTGWHDASRCQVGLRHCWVSLRPTHKGSAIPSYERTQTNFSANPNELFGQPKKLASGLRNLIWMTDTY